MRRRNVSNIIERFQTKHALQEERERKNLVASPNGDFSSGVPDKNGTREKEIFENEQVRVSATSVPKGTDWSAPHDGRDRIVVLLGQINPLAQTNEADSSSSAWRATRIPANSDIDVPNNSDQTKSLMILELKDTAAEQVLFRTEAPGPNIDDYDPDHFQPGHLAARSSSTVTNDTNPIDRSESKHHSIKK